MYLRYMWMRHIWMRKGKFDLNAAGLLAYSHGEYFSLGKKLGRFGYSIQKKKAKKKRK